MVRDGSAFHTGTDARLIAIDGIGDQQFVSFVNKFRVCDREIKEWPMPLKGIVNREYLFELREGPARCGAGAQVNLFSLIASHAECGGGEQEFILQLANV